MEDDFSIDLFNIITQSISNPNLVQSKSAKEFLKLKMCEEPYGSNLDFK